MTAALENSEDLGSLKTAIEGQLVSAPRVVPIDLVSANGKLIKTINNTEEKLTFLMRDDEYEIRLAVPVYVTKITVVLDEFESVKGMKLVAIDLLTNKQVKVSITAEDVTGNAVDFFVTSTITSFALHRKSSFFSKKLKKIQIFGIFLEDIEKFEKEFLDLESLKSNLVSLAQEKIELINTQTKQLADDRAKTKDELDRAQLERMDLDEEKSVLQADVEKLAGSVAELEKSLEIKKAEDAILTAKGSELEKRSISVESELVQKTETLANTNIGISKAEDKLKGLINNVNVFSEEFSGFVDQGTKQVKTYIGLAVVPLILLSIVVYNLFQGAVDLSLKFEKIPTMDLLTLFVTRLPFVTIAFLIVGVSVKILYFLINRIIAIHQQRLDLAKVAIIAKDVSDASADQLQMSIDELYEAKTYLKMNILRAYLADQISTFSYAVKKKEKTDVTNYEGEVLPLAEDAPKA